VRETGLAHGRLLDYPRHGFLAILEVHYVFDAPRGVNAMANRPFLMSHNSEAPLVAAEAEDFIVAAASNQIPLLWLSLFRTSDLRNVDMPLEDAQGNESVGPAPTLLSALDLARAAYQERRTRLRGLIPLALLGHVDEWETLVASLTHRFVQIDLAEIWMMSSPEDFDDAIRDYLAGVNGTSDQGWLDLRSQANVDDPEVARYGLRGYQWEQPVPWND
jgi:hypothetical protein